MGDYCGSEPTSSLSALNSIPCTLDTPDIPKLIELYRPLIVHCVSGLELVSHLSDFIDSRGRQEVRQIGKNLGSIQSMDCLLNLLLDNEKPNKWNKFVEALELNEYRYVARALRGGAVKSDVFKKYRKLLLRHNFKLVNRLDPSDLLPELLSRGLLNDVDKEEIQAEMSNHGKIAGTTVLLDRVWRRHDDWYQGLLEVLCSAGHYTVVENMDLEFAQSWRSQNEFDSKASIGKPAVEPMSIREGYTSYSGPPQNSFGNQSIPPAADLLISEESDLNLDSMLSDCDSEEDQTKREKRVAHANFQRQCQANNKNEPYAEKSLPDLTFPVGNIPETHSPSVSDLHESLERELPSVSERPSGTDYSSMSGEYSGDFSSIHSSTVGKLLDSIENSVDDVIQREGGSRPNIVGPESDVKSVDNNSTESSDDEDAIPAQQLQLRKYQLELARAALNDKNCIIVAPTGSGKTHVAMKIIQNHREKRKRLHITKVAFLVEQSALAEQQGKVCKEFLACKVKVITGEKQRTEKLQNLSCWIQQKDILVITSQILVNALAVGDVRIEDFSLIIFDECHHSHAKHPYNQIMSHYLDLKLEDRHKQLPQIVGLTASVGVGKAKNEEKAMEWIYSMMANMDAEELCVVEENKAELSQHANIPEQKVKKTSHRKKNDFGRTIEGIMAVIQKWMINSKHSTQLGDQSILKPPAARGNDQYTQWLSRLWKEEAKIVDEKARRFIHTCRVYLDMYNKALIIYTDARASDSLAFIREELKKWDEHLIADETDKKLKSFFEKSQANLQINAEDPNHDNPKLLELRKLVINAFETDPDSRGIIFVRTRDLVKAIHRWMEETEDLRQFKPVMFTGAQAKCNAGGMTKVQQTDALALFKDGRHKIVIATSVAEEGLDIQKCNLVIRYSYVSNEIAMVQARGRGRRENGKYFVVTAQGDKTAEREELNMIREAMMDRAIEMLREKFRVNRRECMDVILFMQKKSKTERDLAAKNKDGQIVRQGQYVLRCQKCSKYICMSYEIRKIQDAHHACISDDIKERVRGQRLPKPQFQDEDLKCAVGKLLCRSCGSDLGNVSIYKNAQFPILKIDGFLLEDSMGRRDVKKRWKNAPFDVPTITAEDILQRSHGEKLIEML